MRFSKWQWKRGAAGIHSKIMDKVLLDTDTLSEIIKGVDDNVLKKFAGLFSVLSSTDHDKPECLRISIWSALKECPKTGPIFFDHDKEARRNSAIIG